MSTKKKGNKRAKRPVAMSKKQTTKKRSRQMNTDVALEKASSGALTTPKASDWGAPPPSQRAVIIPRLLVMQGMSEIVSNGKAKLGDIADNLSEEVLGGVDKPLEIIPFKCEEIWRVIHAKGGKLKKTLPYDHTTSGLPFEETDEDGDQVKNVYTLRYYALLAKDIAKGGAIPYIIEFRSSASLKAGKKIYTQMYVKNPASGLPPVTHSYDVTTFKTSGPDGQPYAATDVRINRKISEKEYATAFRWFKTLQVEETQAYGDDEPF